MNDRGTATRPSEYAARLIPEPALANAPADVATANSAAAEALDRHRQLVTAQRQADIEAQRADGEDRAAVKGALDKGKATPKPTAERKREAAAEARAKTEAAAALVEEKFAALDTAISANVRPWLESERASIEAAATEARAAVAEAAERFSDFEQRTGLAAWLVGYDSTRPKMMEPARGTANLSTTEEVRRNPAELFGALASLCTEYPQRLAETTTAVERQAQDRANNLARKAIRHQQLEERQRRTKTTPGVNAG